MSTENTNIFKTNNASSSSSSNSSSNTSNNSSSNTETPLEVINSWDELDINRDLLRGIYAYGFEKPSPIQSKAIKPIIDKRDIIGQAQSGTGKTATFSIGALSRVNINDNFSQVLILSPTHELTHQTAKVITSLSTMMTGIRIKTILGGSSIDNDVDSMQATPPHILVGCPGRVYDMMRRGHINASKLSLVVIDEADEMLSQGFKEQIYNIFQYFSNDIQVALFSATLPENIYRITDKFMRNPVKISVTPEMLTLEGIKQYFVALNNDVEKYSTLKDIFQVISLSHCIIYCNSVKRVADLCEAMREDNFPVCCIHSYMDKAERETSINEFRTGVARVLISSNVTARGIDIQQVSTVINFDIPKDVHTYLHRIGRSGRWGRKGTGINFITRRDVILLKEIEKYYNTQIDELPANFSV
jgi:translation initiation factor 4A